MFMTICAWTIIHEIIGIVIHVRLCNKCVRSHLQEGSKVMGQAGGTPVVPTGLQSHTVPESAQADLTLEVVQSTALSSCVVRGCGTLQLTPVAVRGTDKAVALSSHAYSVVAAIVD